MNTTPEKQDGLKREKVEARNAQVKPASGNRGPQDIGGEPGGPIDTVDHGMLRWQQQANALRGLLTRTGLICTDELRRAAEQLGPRYAELAYFEITTSALRTLMLEKGYFTERELEEKMNEIRRNGGIAGGR